MREHHERVRVRDAGELPVARAAQPPRAPRLADRAGSSFKPLGNARIVHVTCSSAVSMGGKGADADGVLLASDGVKPRKKGCDPGSRYADSKILLERHTRVLARKFDKKNVLVAAVDPGDMLTDYVLKANWRRSGMRYHPAAIVSWAVGKMSTTAFGPHGFGSFTKRQPERGAAAVAHVAVGDVFRNVVGTGRAVESSRTGPARSLGRRVALRGRGRVRVEPPGPSGRRTRGFTRRRR